jgi:hypothetical protein
VSPILVRPVREQLEHDRVIRLLPARYRRRFEVGINPGAEQNTAVGTGLKAIYPDAVLYSPDKARKILGVAEVETVESVNHLEVMSQWAAFGRLKVAFHLYVPASSIDVARRMASEYQVVFAELWSYDNVGDQVRFTLIHRTPEPTRPAAKAAAGARPPASRPSRAAARAAVPTRSARPGAGRATGARGKASAPHSAKAAVKRKSAKPSRAAKAAPRKAQAQKRR